MKLAFTWRRGGPVCPPHPHHALARVCCLCAGSANWGRGICMAGEVRGAVGRPCGWLGGNVCCSFGGSNVVGGLSVPSSGSSALGLPSSEVTVVGWGLRRAAHLPPYPGAPQLRAFPRVLPLHPLCTRHGRGHRGARRGCPLSAPLAGACSSLTLHGCSWPGFPGRCKLTPKLHSSPSLSWRAAELGLGAGSLAKPTWPGESPGLVADLGTCWRLRFLFTLKCPCRFPERKRRTAVAATISFFLK